MLTDDKRISDEEETSDKEEMSARKLPSTDLERIIMGEKLSDLKINFAQCLLKLQFPVLTGLDSTLL